MTDAKHISEVGHDLMRKARSLEAEVHRFETLPVTRATLRDALVHGAVPKVNLDSYHEALASGRELRDKHPGATFEFEGAVTTLSEGVEQLSTAISRARGYSGPAQMVAPTPESVVVESGAPRKRNGLFR